MDTLPFPQLASLNLSTHVQLTEHSYEHAVLNSALASAHATGDVTFRVFRLGQMTLRMDPPLLIDRLALRSDWASLRVNSHTLVVRATHLFGIIEATGAPDKCSLGIQVWTDNPQRGDAAIEGILAEFRQYEFRDISFSLNWRFLDGKGHIARAGTDERASGEVLDEAYPLVGSVQTFIDQYLEAPETVLVLQGSPGTGKTRLIRAILAAISARAGDAPWPSPRRPSPWRSRRSSWGTCRTRTPARSQPTRDPTCSFWRRTRCAPIGSTRGPRRTSRR